MAASGTIFVTFSYFLKMDKIFSQESKTYFFPSVFFLHLYPLLSFIFLQTPNSYFSVFPQFSSLSSFADMSEALRLLSPENRSALPRESFRAFSRIMCGHPEVGGERIPSLNWYEDNDIKSFLGKNGTEDTDLNHDNTTSKRLWTSLFG